jgi:phosphopantothenoylcysteine synthetase/decarboxylase
MKVLLTAGGTEEPIDGVRRLVNRSTGATGMTLAQHLYARGLDVCLLHSQGIDASGLACDTETFLTFDQLASTLQSLLGNQHFDAVIHLAAVGDYHLHSIEVDGNMVASTGSGKLGTGHELVLRLRPNPKLIDQLRGWSINPDLLIVGFKLTDNAEPKARTAQVQTLLERGVADIVVHNDNSEISTEQHVATIYSAGGVITRTQTKKELACAVFELLANGGVS